MKSMRPNHMTAVLALALGPAQAYSQPLDRPELHRAFEEGKYADYLQGLTAWFRPLREDERAQHASELLRSAVAIHELKEHPKAPEWATKVAQALNNLGTVLTDAGKHEEALEHYEQALAALDETATVEDRVVSRGNAAQAARQLEQWDKALDYALQSEAISVKNDYGKTLNELLVAFLAMRQELGPERFAGLFTARLEQLPEDLRPHVRADLHLKPTYRNEKDEPGRNAPCPCGSGKKYKKCCGRKGGVTE